MGAGRIAATCASIAVVAGCAVLVAGMSSVGSGRAATDTPFAMPSAAPHTYADRSWSASAEAAANGAGSSDRTSASASATTSTTRSSHAPTPSAHRTSKPASAASSKPAAKSTTAAQPAPRRGRSLPIGGSTSGATRVITVVAAHYSSTTATLQTWDRAPGGGWLKHGGAVTAHVGSDGVTTSPSEFKSATPVGSFTLTQAFGWKNNPGTGLPYFRTNSADWWISQAGSLYNTHQHCSSGCAFNTAVSSDNPNEHLAAIQVYAEAVVIDYNTRNSPTGVQKDKGSAFFLHVTDGTATAGCVAIPESSLISIMKWLTPSAHPRILIGVAG